MGCRKEESIDALLFTTMCIIGLPVDVYIKDGSVYSGIFHTACVRDEYAIVLKSAKMIKKGSRDANVASRSFLETLIIVSEDLVQVVAKEVVLSADSIPGYFNRDNIGTFSSKATCLESMKPEMKATKSNESTMYAEKASKERQVQDGFKDKKQSDYRESHEPLGERIILEVQGASSNLDVSLTRANASENVHFKANSEISSNGISSGAPPLQNIKLDDQILRKTPCMPPTSSGIPTTYVACVNSSADLVPPRSSIHNATTKESKLNPEAKIFSPSTLQHRTVTPPVVPVATAEPEVEITPYGSHPSLPVKFVPYNNLAAGNDVQYSQPTIGYMGSRTQPARYASQYHHLQAATGYVYPNSQNFMVGRLGQLVYMHPASHDVHQSTMGFSQVSSRPVLIPHQVHPPKHQGSTAAQTLQLYMTPPVVAGLQQPFTMPNVPITQQSFPVMRPVQVSGTNAFLPNKFA